MNWVLPVVVGLVGLGGPALFAASTVSRAPQWRAKSRVDVLVGALTALVTLVFAHEYFAWWLVPVVLWLLPVGILAVGAAGAVIRWPWVPWIRHGRTLRRTIVGAVGSVVVAAALLMVVL